MAALKVDSPETTPSTAQDIYAAQLAQAKSKKVDAAEKLLEKAQNDGKVKKLLNKPKPGRGRGRGRGRGKTQKEAGDEGDAEMNECADDAQEGDAEEGDADAAANGGDGDAGGDGVVPQDGNGATPGNEGDDQKGKPKKKGTRAPVDLKAMWKEKDS